MVLVAFAGLVFGLLFGVIGYLLWEELRYRREMRRLFSELGKWASFNIWLGAELGDERCRRYIEEMTHGSRRRT